MSGHNKWSSIKHKKGAADAKRGKLFSRLSKEITLAAREGGADADMNPRLRTAIAAAKDANMPNDNIDRAVKKGTGELGADTLEELTYEGYAPGGVAVIVNCLSDNRNRTAATVRSCFTKHNSNIANNGAVSYMFQRKARFVVEGEHADEDALMETIFDAGVDVENIIVEDGSAEIIAPPDAFAAMADCLDSAGIPISESSLVMIPDTSTPVNDPGTARQVLRLVEALEEDDDVQQVFTNFEIDDDLMDELASES